MFVLEKENKVSYIYFSFLFKKMNLTRYSISNNNIVIEVLKMDVYTVG